MCLLNNLAMYTNTAARQPEKIISLQFHGFLASGNWNVLGEATNHWRTVRRDQLPSSLLEHCPFDRQDMQNRYLHVQRKL